MPEAERVLSAFFRVPLDVLREASNHREFTKKPSSIWSASRWWDAWHRLFYPRDENVKAFSTLRG